MRGGLLLGSGLEDSGEVGSHPKEDEEPEEADDGGHGESRRGHCDVDEVDVDDHPRQRRQCQRHVAIDEEQDCGSDLEEAEREDVVGNVRAW